MKPLAGGAAIIAVIFLYGCGPCVFVTDERACNSAYFNAPRLPALQIGMTQNEVKKVLGNREASTETEVWYYMSDYERELMAKLTFADGKLSRIEQVNWETN